jgi:HK97 family phage major capsid protein
MSKILELREKRMTLATRARELLTLCDTAKREMSAEEKTNWNACHDEIDRIAEQLKVLERQQKIDDEIALTRTGPQTQLDIGAGGGAQDSEQRKARVQRVQSDFRSYLRTGVTDPANLATATDPDSGRSVQGFAVPLLSPSEIAQRQIEHRAVGETTGGGASGITGFGVSEGFQIKLWEALKSYSSVREAPISYQATEQGNNLPEMLVDDTSNQGELLTENTQTASNADASFTQVTLGAYMFSSKSMLFSHQALQDIAALEDRIGEMAGIRIGRIQGSYFTNGNGSGQPLGILAAAITASGSNSSLLASGSTVVAGGGGPTGWVYNDVINLEHSIDPAYRSLRVGTTKACGFMFNDHALRQTKLIKDSQGRPLWLSGFTALGGESPDTIDGFPYYVNQFMPNFGTTTVGSVTTANYPALFGYFPAFKVRDVKEIIVLRLVERYADYLQVGYIGFMRSDSKMIQQNAVGVFQNSAT